jgi:hypothetical protein
VRDAPSFQCLERGEERERGREGGREKEREMSRNSTLIELTELERGEGERGRQEGRRESEACDAPFGKAQARVCASARARACARAPSVSLCAVTVHARKRRRRPPLLLRFAHNLAISSSPPPPPPPAWKDEFRRAPIIAPQAGLGRFHPAGTIRPDPVTPPALSPGLLYISAVPCTPLAVSKHTMI